MSQHWHAWRCRADVAQVHAARFVDLADLVDGRVLQYADAGIGEELGDFLRFAERVGVNHRRFVVGERVGDDLEQPGDRFVARRQAVVRQAEGALHHEHVGVRQLGRLGGGGGVELEIAGVEQRLVAIVGQQHRGAETVAGGQRGEPQASRTRSVGRTAFRGRGAACRGDVGRAARWWAWRAPARGGRCGRCGRARRRSAAGGGGRRRRAGAGQEEAVVVVEHRRRGQGTGVSGVSLWFAKPQALGVGGWRRIWSHDGPRTADH